MFSTTLNLEKHINAVHNGQKDPKYCGMAFSQLGHLNKHINIVHNGHKDHKSEVFHQQDI